MDDELLLLDEVAKHCRTTVATVRHWVATGADALQAPGRRRLVRRSALEAFLDPGAGTEAARGDDTPVP